MTNNMTERIYLVLYSFTATIVGLIILYKNEYVGELRGIKTNLMPIEIIVFIVIHIFLYISVYYFYKYTKDKKIKIHNVKLNINISKLNIFFFFLIVADLIFLISTGVGRLFSNASHPLSPVFAIFDATFFFPIYYFLVRENKYKKLFIFNVILFVLYKILQGWSAILFLIAFYELYMYFKYKDIRYSIIKIILLPIALIIIGSYFYKYVFEIKMEMRGQPGIQLNYLGSLDELTNRLTNIHMSLGSYEKIDEIRHFYLRENIFLKESQGFFKPILPRLLMENKDFRSLNNNVKQPFYDDFSADTSADIGIIMYTAILFYSDPMQAINYIIFTLLLLFLMKTMLDLLEQQRGQFDFIYFILLFSLVYTASLEHVFARGIFGTLYILPLLFMLGIIKIKLLTLKKGITNDI